MAASYVPSLVRTFVPVLIGAAVAWLGVRGFHLDAGQQAMATAIATTLVTSIYYALVRALETKFPAFGLMLGYKAKPIYKHPAHNVTVHVVPGSGPGFGGSVEASAPEHPPVA